jgi:hypothetical protein
MFGAGNSLAQRAAINNNCGMTQDRDCETLKDLTEEERELVLAVIEHHPKLTIEEAIEALREAGM